MVYSPPAARGWWIYCTLYVYLIRYAKCVIPAPLWAPVGTSRLRAAPGFSENLSLECFTDDWGSGSSMLFHSCTWHPSGARWCESGGCGGSAGACLSASLDKSRQVAITATCLLVRRGHDGDSSHVQAAAAAKQRLLQAAVSEGRRYKWPADTTADVWLTHSATGLKAICVFSFCPQLLVQVETHGLFGVIYCYTATACFSRFVCNASTQGRWRKCVFLYSG